MRGWGGVVYVAGEKLATTRCVVIDYVKRQYGLTVTIETIQCHTVFELFKHDLQDHDASVYLDQVDHGISEEHQVHASSSDALVV